MMQPPYKIPIVLNTEVENTILKFARNQKDPHGQNNSEQKSNVRGITTPEQE